MSTDKYREGGCICAATRYRMLAPPLVVHCCHCTWCQRESGSAFVVNALIEADRVEQLSGHIEMILTPTASGAGQKIFRCDRCKIALWSRYALPKIGDLINFVRVGTLDVPGSLPPDVHIFTNSRLPWLSLAGEIPVYTEYYKTDEVWSTDSLERRRALAAD